MHRGRRALRIEGRYSAPRQGALWGIHGLCSAPKQEALWGINALCSAPRTAVCWKLKVRTVHQYTYTGSVMTNSRSVQCTEDGGALRIEGRYSAPREGALWGIHGLCSAPRMAARYELKVGTVHRRRERYEEFTVCEVHRGRHWKVDILSFFFFLSFFIYLFLSLTFFYQLTVGAEDYYCTWWHSVTHASAPVRAHSVRLLWRRDMHNTQHSQKTESHAPGENRTRNPTKRAAASPKT